MGTGDPIGVLAEMLAATMNPNLGGLDHAANYVEQQVLDWWQTDNGLSSRGQRYPGIWRVDGQPGWSDGGAQCDGG